MLAFSATAILFPVRYELVITLQILGKLYTSSGYCVYFRAKEIAMLPRFWIDAYPTLPLLHVVYYHFV